jgi:uncharacterized membrane protein
MERHIKDNAITILKESGIILLSLLALSAVFKILFKGTGWIDIIRMISGILWLLIIPGYILMYRYSNYGILERIVIGMAVTIALEGFLSYFIGLLGINANIHHMILPPVLMIAFLLINLFLPRKQSSKP